MVKNKKILFVGLLAIFVGTLMIITYASAVDIVGQGSLTGGIAQKAGYEVGQDEYSLSRTVGSIIKSVLSVIGVIFLVLTIYAGVLWMTAAGNEEKVTKATGIIKAAVIGLIIVVLSYGVTALVMNFVVGAQAPSSDTGGSYNSPSAKMGCCVKMPNKDKCTQTASVGSCTTKWEGAIWYPGESCTPYITQNTGCEFEVSL
ncbi:MAG: pilin [Patescibacteria group bacterium]|nr:pilin [Patescibacteria group bacterium]